MSYVPPVGIRICILQLQPVPEETGILILSFLREALSLGEPCAEVALLCSGRRIQVDSQLPACI